jgi:hypothetical protein
MQYEPNASIFFFFGKEVHIHVAGLRSRTLHNVRLLVDHWATLRGLSRPFTVLNAWVEWSGPFRWV